MRKLLPIFILICFKGYGQGFPTIDSLRNYNTKWTTNSALNFFQNLRGQTLLRGIIDRIDSVRIGGGGSGAVSVDSIRAINDTTLQYRKNNVNYTFYIRGNYDYRRKVDSIYRVNDTTLRAVINGTGRDIVIKGSAAGAEGVASGYESLTILRGISNADVKSTATYITRAYGVNNFFKYDTSTTLADDSAMTIVTEGGKRLKRITDGYINAAWFGAVPDDGSDDSRAFEKLFYYLDTVTTLKEYKVFIPGGKYQLNRSISLPGDLYNPGSGAIPRMYVEGNGAVFYLTGAITGFKRTVTSTTDANNKIGSYTLTMSGIEFVGTQTTGQKGIELHAYYGADINNMMFTNLDTGIVARFILGSKFDNILYANNKSVGILGASLDGVASGASTSNSAFNANLITKNRVFCASNSYAAMMFLAADGCDFVDNIIEGSKPTYSFYYDYQGSTAVNGNHINGMWFEAWDASHPYNTALKLRVNGVFSINRIQNDYADTIINWNNSVSGSCIKLDNVEYWNFPEKPFKGTPPSGFQFYIGLVNGITVENLFTSGYYNDGIPQNVFSLHPHPLAADAGMGILSATTITIKPGISQSTYLNKYVLVKGGIHPDSTNAYNLGTGSRYWDYSYVNKSLVSNFLLLGPSVSDDGVNRLQVNGSIKSTQFNLSDLNTAPSSATATGTKGEIRVTSGYIYVCTATNTWVRAALATW